MTYAFQGDVAIEHRTCAHCDAEHEMAIGLVLKDGDAHAAYWAEWFPHQQEAFLSATFGSFEQPDYADHVTFACGFLLGDDTGWSAGLIRSQVSLLNEAILGHKLDREEALKHPWVDAFWALVDWLVENDPLLQKHVNRAT